MIKLTISPRAEEDLREIGDFIAKDNIDAAISFIQRLRHRCAGLLLFPTIGRKRDELRQGYRSVTEGDYVVLYKMLGEEELVIVRIIHGMRDLGNALND